MMPHMVSVKAAAPFCFSAHVCMFLCDISIALCFIIKLSFVSLCMSLCLEAFAHVDVGTTRDREALRDCKMKVYNETHFGEFRLSVINGLLPFNLYDLHWW